MLLQVHDELVLEVPRPQLEATAGLVRQVMEAAYPLAIPLSTDAKWGTNWEEMEPVR
jgi:DNA polymerase-1